MLKNYRKPIKLVSPSGEVKKITSGYSGFWLAIAGAFYLPFLGLWKWFFVCLVVFAVQAGIEELYPPSQPYLIVASVLVWTVFIVKFGTLLTKRYERQGWTRVD